MIIKENLNAIISKWGKNYFISKLCPIDWLHHFNVSYSRRIPYIQVRTLTQSKVTMLKFVYYKD